MFTSSFIYLKFPTNYSLFYKNNPEGKVLLFCITLT